MGAHVVKPSIARKERLEKEVLRWSISGKRIKRYRVPRRNQLIIYTGKATEIKRFPRVLDHLKTFRPANTCKEVAQQKHPWWSLHRPRDPGIFQSPKFIGITTSRKIEIVFDADESLYVTDAMYVFRLRTGCDPYTCMAIVQSQLFLFLYRVANQGESRVIPQVKASKLYDLPYPTAVTCDEHLGDLAQTMVSLHERHAQVRTEHEKEVLRRQIEATDRQIDQLVYELYGLTDEEVRLVEQTVAEPS